MKVDFMIIGAQKCGTSSLFTLLNNHQNLSGCKIKEPHYFSKTGSKLRSIDEYHGLFDQSDNTLYFEASTSYTFYPHCSLSIHDDIYEYNLGMKFIYVVRNPIDRIISSYIHSLERGYISDAIDKAVMEHAFFADATRYYTQVYQYIKRFGRDSVLVVLFADLIHNTEKVLSDIAEFLGIDINGFASRKLVHQNATARSTKKHHKYDSGRLVRLYAKHAAPYVDYAVQKLSGENIESKSMLDVGMKRALIDMLEIEILELQKLTNLDLSDWLTDD